MGKLNCQISVRLRPEVRDAMAEIEDRHRIAAAEYVRGLIEAGVALYRAQGYFSFPVEVVPGNPGKARGKAPGSSKGSGP